MKLWLLLAASLALWAQNDIQSIVERDPFDPDRGKKEEVEGQEEAVEDIGIEDLPILDGTMIIGNLRIAMLSFTKDGRTIAARVEMRDGQQGYRVFLRDPGAEKEEHDLSSSRLGMINGKIAGYSVSLIQRNEVRLEGIGEPVMLKMYDGKKENRGGSKRLPTPTSRRRRPAVKELTPVAAKQGEPQVKTITPPATTTKKSVFTKRNTPPRISPRARSKSEKRTKKF